MYWLTHDPDLNLTWLHIDSHMTLTLIPHDPVLTHNESYITMYWLPHDPDLVVYPWPLSDTWAWSGLAEAFCPSPPSSVGPDSLRTRRQPASGPRRMSAPPPSGAPARWSADSRPAGTRGAGGPSTASLSVGGAPINDIQFIIKKIRVLTLWVVSNLNFFVIVIFMF